MSSLYWNTVTPLLKTSLKELMQRYPYGHDEGMIRANLIDFRSADDDFDPTCLHEKYWELVKWDITRSLH